jgi:hypothetical protein
MFTEFTKLKSNFYLHDVETKEQQMFYGDDGKGIGYYHTDFPRKFDLMQLLVPPELQKYFAVTLMKINVFVPPHIDNGIKSTINIYLETGNCTTHFYKFATDNPKTSQVGGQSDGMIYDEEDLIETGSFMAEPYEAWLLDVTLPHSVKPGKDFKERTAVAISSVLCYHDVKLILDKKGLI